VTTSFARSAGWSVVRQRRSHFGLKHPERRTALTVPLHREVKRGTSAGILSDAGVEVERFLRLLK
jgi:predicted RNA binding protein YcfA (HicA-like mRNA interferase family)